ncbi:MAG: LytTR family transcriptional regulator DNA-binding domain-containing protein [Lachnospiraceae bacterium]|nr:LytTR family transcriptional regulator DNA-binding domain-containing protein [Lachnospiraceae bacterium]
MRITIEPPDEGQEDEIIIKCANIDDELMAFLESLKNGTNKIPAHSETGITMLSPQDVFYFESVDNKTFVYMEKSVFEVKKKLYELEMDYANTNFLRISKSIILNISKIVHLRPLLYGRFEGELKNGEKIIISRQYMGDLRRKLGL